MIELVFYSNLVHSKMRFYSKLIHPYYFRTTFNSALIRSFIRLVSSLESANHNVTLSKNDLAIHNPLNMWHLEKNSLSERSWQYNVEFTIEGVIPAISSWPRRNGKSFFLL